MGTSDFDSLVQKQQADRERVQRDDAAAARSRDAQRLRDSAEFDASLRQLAAYLGERLAPRVIVLGPRAKRAAGGVRPQRFRPYTSPPGWLLWGEPGGTSSLVLLADGRLWRYNRPNNHFPPRINGIWDTAAEWQQYGYCVLLNKTFQRAQDIISYHWYNDNTMESGYTPLDEYLATLAINVLEGHTTA